MARKFTIELLDIPYFARPSIGALDAALTARRIEQLRRGGGGGHSYDPAIKLIADMTTGLAKLEDILGALPVSNDEMWHEQLEEVAEMLFRIFGAEPGRWYPADRKPHPLFDRLWFKHAIRGVWLREGRATASLINPRKSLAFDDLIRSFLARGVEEFYLRDDPNIADYVIIDLGMPPRAAARRSLVYRPHEIELMPLERFEDILRRFLQAVELAGFASQPSTGQSISDLFRRK